MSEESGINFLSLFAISIIVPDLAYFLLKGELRSLQNIESLLDFSVSLIILSPKKVSVYMGVNNG